MGLRILVTDGDERAALAIVRALGAAGHHVVVGGRRARSLAGASRHAAVRVALPDPIAEPAAFVAAVAALVPRERLDLVLPVSEASLLATLGERERLAPARLPFPDLATFRRVADKGDVLRTAAGLGVHIPAQHEFADGATARAAALTYPVVLKPSRSVGEHGGERRKLGVSYATSAEEYAARLDALPPQAYPILVQQRIAGPGIGIFLLRWDGRTVARFAHQRIREKPPSGGVSVYREAVDAPADLMARSEALLAAYDWQGVAMVEYKRDAATGDAYLMEVNGRFWGSVQLPIDAGVDFPNLLVACAVGSPPAAAPVWRTGVGLRWELGELDHVLARFRRHGVRDGFRALGDVLRPTGGRARGEVWRRDDPRPFLHEAAAWLRFR